jgi:hypothetical protein
MAQNFGLSRRLQPELTPKQAPKEPPREWPWIPCDADHHCDRAVCAVVVVVSNVAKRIYFCGHHFRYHRMHIFERGYEVEAL